jgi:hypothetical protein
VVDGAVEVAGVDEPGVLDDEACDDDEEDPQAAITAASPKATYRTPTVSSVRGVRRPSK